ncbi:DUF1266 domain-containing protein [Algoriphagus sp. C2-6-M1]|uniref:DUF1266 domain-containing protein n=1 Tax=Algoriphagus persicinus TaxID=3108754 RepID=UPI002B3E201C|nr:DUF1266 domain-containing protein [Algoriphagus sp. C2-6-M1]MEB2782454.1 DUF1266 domain-containing protein [Algoriphagus sp. C2-6-M1]
MFENLPWYGYVILALAIGSYAYKYFKIGKTEFDKPTHQKAKFKKSPDSQLKKDQLFSLAFYTPIAEWWGADTNTLTFLDAKAIQPYMKGWGIDTQTDYWNLAEYFMKDGRRLYFDFIHQMIQTVPKENWEVILDQKFGNNELAQSYLKLLSTGESLHKLKEKGILTFDSELDLGIAGYDAAILVGQARKAFTAKLITEEDAWKVIDFAKQLAKSKFSSWKEFGKSFALGLEMDMRDDHNNYTEEILHLYKQALEAESSPWNNINWS